jgi:hypothetical protein
MFTGLFTGTRRANRAYQAACEAHEALQKMQLTVAVLEDRLATLEGQHKKLRGRFYAAGPDPESSPESSREARKADAFKKAGWSAGKAITKEH